MSESAFKQLKVQDYSCSQCTKRFNDFTAYQTHIKVKHTQPKLIITEVKSENRSPAYVEPRPEVEKAKVLPETVKAPVKPKNKNKGSEQMQQDAEDKIYAFLGELGVKHVEPDSQQENVLINQSQINEDDDRMMGQANYLENNIVRTPFEVQLDVKKQVELIQCLGRPGFDQVLETVKREAIALNEKLALETERWYEQGLFREFRDPIQMEKEEEDQFSLINIPNVLNNYRKKGLDLKYPEFSVFLLWLAKICKALSWKEFFIATAYICYKYSEYLNTKPQAARSQASWKSFFQEIGPNNLSDIVEDIQDNLHLLNKEQVGTFIDLYEKWVCYFDPF